MKINNSIKTIIVTYLLIAITTPQIYSMKRCREWIEEKVWGPQKRVCIIDPQLDSPFSALDEYSIGKIVSFLYEEDAVHLANTCRLMHDIYQPHHQVRSFEVTFSMLGYSFNSLVNFLGQQENLNHLEIYSKKIDNEQLKTILEANNGRLKNTLQSLSIKHKHGNILDDLSPITNIQNLKRLCLSKIKCSDEQLRTIIEGNNNLISLEIDFCNGLNLSPLTQMHKLKHLSLMNPYIEDEQLEVVIENNKNTLKSLTLTYCFLHNFNVLTNIQNLEELSLEFSPITNEVLQAVIASNKNSLRFLSLKCCKSVNDFSLLANTQRLEGINLFGTTVANEELRMIITANLNTLRYLNLKFCKNLKDFYPLANAEKLVELNLCGTQITHEELRAIVEANKNNLNYLNIGYCEFLNNFNALNSIQNLKELQLEKTSITDNELSTILESNNGRLKNTLTCLNLSYCQNISPALVNQLREENPDIYILYYQQVAR